MCFYLFYRIQGRDIHGTVTALFSLYLNLFILQLIQFFSSHCISLLYSIVKHYTFTSSEALKIASEFERCCTNKLALP